MYRMADGTDAFMEAVADIMAARMTPDWDTDMRPNDLEALAAMLLAEDGILSYGFKDLAPALTMPCLFFVGEDDEIPDVRQYIEGMPNATYVGLPGLDHLDAWLRTDLVLPYVKRFLAKVGDD